MTRLRKMIVAFVAASLVTPVCAQNTFTWHGFGTARGAAGADGPLAQDDLSAQLHLGVDWSPSVFFGAHAHLLARTDDGDSKKGAAGVVEAYLESNAFSPVGRFRFRGGAFFLPTSFENIDSLWENPYAISSSALNTWFGEELRPIGLDVTWLQQGVMVGGTVFRGNETLGALPPARGWQLHDRWTMLGQRVPVDGSVFTSVSAENDGRLGWAARAGWTGRDLAFQFTHFDNRSDGLKYGDLYNWNTKFDIVGLGFYRGDWTVLAESGWGPTFLVVRGKRFISDIRASYVLVSKAMPSALATLRIDSWDDGVYEEESLTAAWIWSVSPKISLAFEVATTDEETRGQVQLRYGFSR